LSFCFCGCKSTIILYTKKKFANLIIIRKIVLFLRCNIGINEHII
jgi:hypothetical protein